MNRVIRLLFIAPVLIVPLTACSSNGGTWDPTDIFDNEFFNHKKPLPGDRKLVFPEGTPGVPHGVPQDLVRGYQPPANAATDPTLEAAAPAEDSDANPETKPEPKPKAKPKPKPRKVVAAPQQPRATAVTVGRREQPPEPAQTSAVPVQAPAGGVQWPDPPPMPR